MFREMHKLDQDVYAKKFCGSMLFHTSKLLELFVDKREKTAKYTDTDVICESLIQKNLLMGSEHDLVIVVELVMVPHPHNRENHDCGARLQKLD